MSVTFLLSTPLYQVLIKIWTKGYIFFLFLKIHCPSTELVCVRKVRHSGLETLWSSIWCCLSDKIGLCSWYDWSWRNRLLKEIKNIISLEEVWLSDLIWTGSNKLPSVSVVKRFLKLHKRANLSLRNLSAGLLDYNWKELRFAQLFFLFGIFFLSIIYVGEMWCFIRGW